MHGQQNILKKTFIIGIILKLENANITMKILSIAVFDLFFISSWKVYCAEEIIRFQMESRCLFLSVSTR